MSDRYLHGSTQLDSISADGTTSVATSTVLSGVAKGNTALQPADIINNLSSTASNKALAAAQGKILSDKISAIEGRGRFLSIWDASLGQPNDLPGGGSSTTEVYTYKTGDYFIVKVAGNKVPSGTSIPVGTTIATFPSTTGASSSINDSIYFNGTTWAVLHTPYGTGDVTGPTSATDNHIATFNGATGKVIKDSGYTIATSVPSEAIFTGTKNTAGSTDTSSKIFLVGATSQAANPQTYSHDTAYIGTDGELYSGGNRVLKSTGDTMTGDLTLMNDQSHSTINIEGALFLSNDYFNGTITADSNLILNSGGTGDSKTTVDGTIIPKNATLATSTDLAAKVTGAASSTDNAIARFDGATGKLIQNSKVTIDDDGKISFGYGDYIYADKNNYNFSILATSAHDINISSKKIGCVNINGGVIKAGNIRGDNEEIELSTTFNGSTKYFKMPLDAGGSSTAAAHTVATREWTNTTYIGSGGEIFQTNPFGGKKLYISTIDNALASADKKYWITAYRHSTGGGTYPRIRSGASVTDDNYYEDGPVLEDISTWAPSIIFDGNYENNFTCNAGEYIRIRIMFGSNTSPSATTSYFGGYPYGSFFLSYYYDSTPQRVSQYRVYNKHSGTGDLGWQDYSAVIYEGSLSGTEYMEQIIDGENLYRSCIEFIVYGKDTTRLSEIDWKLTRPRVYENSSIVHKYSDQELYHDFIWYSDHSEVARISANGQITATNGVALGNTISLKTDSTYSGLHLKQNNVDRYAFYPGYLVSQTITPTANNTSDLGVSGNAWRHIYVVGNLTDGTNSVTVANIAKKSDLTQVKRFL